MVVRNRSSVKADPKGTSTWHFGDNTLQIGGEYPIVTSRGHCEDTVFSADNGPFYVDAFEMIGGRINGHDNAGTIWEGYIADAYSNPGDFVHHQPGDSPDNLAAATTGARMTNPSRPLVDVPAEIAQLYQVPDLIRTNGLDWRGRPKKGFEEAPFGIRGAQAYVETKFGINPYIDDLIKLLNFKEALNKRSKEIEKAKQRGLKRTVTVYNGSVNSEELPWLVQSNFGYFVVPSRWISTEEVRVHCRWFPSATFFPWESNDEPLIEQARRALLGKTIDMATAWELIPWSWLMDWCGTVGDYLVATRNVVGVHLGSVSVMRHQRSEYHMGSSNLNGNARVQPCVVKRDTKNRTLSTVFPEAHWPFLNEDQMGIAASLTVLKSSDLTLR